MESKESCVFYADWLEAANAIEDVSTRCKFFEAVIGYALTGEIENEAMLPIEIKVPLAIIKKCVDRDKTKYEKKIEKRRMAGILGNQKRWGTDQQNIANIANAKNESQTIANIADNDNVNGNDSVNVNDKSKDLNNPPLTPRGGMEAGNFIFLDFYKTVQQIPIPQAIADLKYENQYAWRMAASDKGYAVEVSAALSATKDMGLLQQAIQDINKRHKANVPFQMVKLAMAMRKLKNPSQVDAILEEEKRSAAEPGIYKTLEDKVEYMLKGNKIGNLKKFLQARQT